MSAPVSTALRVGLATLRENPLRTFLSTLGVTIGVASLVAVLSLGDGMERYGTDRIRGEGMQLVTVSLSSADTAAVTVPVIDSRPAAVSGSATESEADAETATVPRSGTEPVPAPHLSDTATRSTD